LCSFKDSHQFKDKKNSGIVLFPQPSDDVNDPLNWPKWKKAAAFLSVVFYAFLGSWVLGGITLGIPGMIQDLKIDLNRAITGLTSWVVLTLGVAVMHLLVFSDLHRTFCGLLWLSPSGNDRCSFSFHSLPLQQQFGALNQSRLIVWLEHELCVLLHSLPVRRSPPLSVPISSFSTNVVGGWVFI
jgi:hypothetical protein